MRREVPHAHVQAYENMGLATTQLLAPFFDGMTHHTPAGLAFKARCEAVGFKEAVRERDGGVPFWEPVTLRNLARWDDS